MCFTGLDRFWWRRGGIFRWLFLGFGRFAFGGAGATLVFCRATEHRDLGSECATQPHIWSVARVATATVANCYYHSGVTVTVLFLQRRTERERERERERKRERTPGFDTLRDGSRRAPEGTRARVLVAPARVCTGDAAYTQQNRAVACTMARAVSIRALQVDSKQQENGPCIWLGAKRPHCHAAKNLPRNQTEIPFRLWALLAWPLLSWQARLQTCRPRLRYHRTCCSPVSLPPPFSLPALQPETPRIK